MTILESYECKKCGQCAVNVDRDEDTGLFYYDKKVGRKIHEDKVPTFDGTEEFTYCPDYQGPDSSYWYKYEKVYTYEYPDTIKCPTCKRKTGKRASIYYFSVGNGRNSYAAKRERQRFAMDGMDKKQAEQFYKESVEASKERMKSGDQHYKKIVPHYETLQKEGIVTRLNDEQTANKIETLKRANQQITKDGKIGRGVKKR